MTSPDRIDNPARHFLWTLALVAAGLALIAVTVNYTIDRYYVFHPQEGVFEEILEPNTRVLKAAYLDDHCGDFDALILGSSRAAVFPAAEFERLFGVRTYNFSVASGSLPGILARLQWLAGKGCMPARVFIAMSIDRLQFPARPNDLLRKEYPPIVGGGVYYREFMLSYLGSDALFSNLGKAVERVFNRPAPRFRYDMRSGDVDYLWDRELTLPACPAAPVATDILAIRRYAGYLRQIRDLVSAHGAELTLVWNPITRAEQLAHLQDARQLFPEIEGVSDHVYRLPVTDPRLADGRYYHDPGHFKPELAVASVASPGQRVSLERLLAELESAGQACP